MPKNDLSPNPLKGFTLVHWPQGVFLHCHGRECHWRKKINRICDFEELLLIAATHRAECLKPVQARKSIEKLPFVIIPKSFLPLAEDRKILAYTVGSYWYCPTHGRELPNAEAVYEGNTFAVYEYRCDEPGCGIKLA